MFDWKIFAVLTPLFFAIFQSLSKLLPKSISPLLVGAYASFVGFVVLLILHLLLSENKSIILGSKSLIIVIVIGTLIALGNFSIFKAYNLGAPQSIFTLIAYVLLIAFGILFGILFWRERLTLSQIFGILLSIAGILIVIYSKSRQH